jgi:hypothetical protein
MPLEEGAVTPQSTSLGWADLPFSELARRVLGDLAAGRCAAVVGLSNTGKSTFMRGLATPPAQTAYAAVRGRPGRLLYVDGNLAVAISVQAFYEVVLRSLLEALADEASADLYDHMRAYHASITEAENDFGASLSFNLALSDLCQGLGSDLCLLLDEFDEIYSALEGRALLNMRALRDRFPDRLLFVTATVRRLPGLRDNVVEDEFAEMFSQSTHVMPSLSPKDIDPILTDLGLAPTGRQADLCYQLSGGHPGLLLAVAQALAGSDTVDLAEGLLKVSREPQPKAECLKIWNQLGEEERGWLAALVTQTESRLPAPQMAQMESLGLVHDGEVFSPVLASFVGRRSRAPGVDDRGIQLDPDSGDVWVDGVRIPVLTDLEYRLMALLDERRDKVTDKYKIVTSVWGEDYLGDVDDARVEKLVSRLRGKIESDPSNPRYLVTLRGRGYKLLTHPKKS